MIKVIHFISSLSVSSGLMSVIMNYYRHVDRSKIQFGFMYFKKITEGSFEKEIKELGGECFLINMPSYRRKFIEYMKLYLKSNCSDYSVFHLHELYLTRLLMKTIDRNKFKTIIGHAHTTKFSDKFLSSIRNRLLCLGIAKKFDVRLACSKNAGITYFGNNSFEVLFNAINTEYFYYSDEARKKIRNELGINEKALVLGNVGRLCKQKNQIMLLKIYRCFKANHPNSKLLIVGDGPLKEGLEKYARKKGIVQDILFVGKRDDTNLLYSAMDAFVFPSLFEGLGIVLVEAQANGLACLSSSVVPNEARIIPTFSYLSLKEKPSRWANMISFQRILDTSSFFSCSKYDIRFQSGFLESIYSTKTK